MEVDSTTFPSHCSNMRSELYPSPNHLPQVGEEQTFHHIVFQDNRLFLPLQALHVIPEPHKVMVRNTIVRQSSQDLVASTGILDVNWSYQIDHFIALQVLQITAVAIPP
jgi:hypothetical protein